jgi:hypothetical protein
MTWLLIALAWTLLACAVAAVVGNGIRLADEDVAPAAWTDEIDAFLQRSTAGGVAEPAAGPQVPLL